MYDQLKVYRREKDQWPWHQKVNIKPAFRRKLAVELARRFEIPLMGRVYLDKRGDAGHVHKVNSFLGGGEIHLPSPAHSCRLSVIFHEVAHLLDYKKYGGWGHRATFWTALCTVYSFVDRATLRDMLRRIVEQNRLEAALSKSLAERHMRRAQRKAEEKVYRQGPEYRLKTAQDRVKRLRTRAKRIATLLKSAERSLRARERSVQKAGAEVVMSQTKGE